MRYWIWLFIATVIVGIAAASAARAGPLIVRENPVAGTYSILAYEIKGREPQRNPRMPWLYLLENFAYEWGSARGTYEIRDNAVWLSGAYKIWGPGKLLADRRLLFHFTRKDQAGRTQEITVLFIYRGTLRDYPPPSRRTSGPASPATQTLAPPTGAPGQPVCVKPA